MNPMIQRICGLLQSPNHMRRCAAAITLAELAPQDDAVVRALGATLEGANPMLTTYVLEAFEAIGSAAAVPFALPLLDAPEMETKLRAAAIVARAGNAVVPDIRARLDQAPPSHKPVFVDLLARIHTKDAFRVILELLFHPDFELVRAACEAVRRHLAGADARTRALLHKEVVPFMTTPKVREQERVLTSCLLLLGAIGRPEARALLLKHAAPSASLYVRRHALIALKGLELTGAAATGLATAVLPFVNDPDEGLAKHALDLLDRFPLPAKKAPWAHLLGSPHAAVRSFAARKVAANDDAAANRTLLELLRHEDTDVSETAARALAAHAGATRLLLDALAREPATEPAWRLAKILKPHGERVDKKTLAKFATAATRDLAAGNPRYEALLYFVRNVDAAAADRVLRDAGLEHLRAKRWPQAVECLRRIAGTEGFDEPLRYALSVANLKGSPKDLNPQLRAEDHALRGFQALLRARVFPLFAELKKDKRLELAELFYVGFHFAEAPGEERDFGRQMLEHIAKTSARTEWGKAAKNKLKLI